MIKAEEYYLIQTLNNKEFYIKVEKKYLNKILISQKDKLKSLKLKNNDIKFVNYDVGNIDIVSVKESEEIVLTTTNKDDIVVNHVYSEVFLYDDYFQIYTYGYDEKNKFKTENLNYNFFIT